MSFVADVVDSADRSRLALVAIGADGERREISFGEAADRSARLAGALAERGVARGDVVMTVVGNRPEWAYAMLACWRLGAVAQPCTEQLRPADLRARMEMVETRAVVADARDLDLVTRAGFDGPILVVPDEALFEAAPLPASECALEEPALIVFTSGTAGEPKPVRHGHGYLYGQRVQAEHWYGAHPGDLCWCTAASGWSLSARNACAAGEPLNPEVVRAWQEACGVAIHDGYGQTETGHLTGMPIGPPVRPGSMGRPLPGFRAWIDDGELVVDPRTVPTFFLDGARDEPWRTGDRVSEDEDGYLWFEGRTDDVIISAGYRIGPFEVESALVSHPAVAEAAAVAAPDEERGSIVRAVVVLRDGHEPGDALARELQQHVKIETAPYKYPRIVEFADELPKTTSGKIRRALLRGG